MKTNLLILLLCIGIGNQIKAQSLSETEIVGKWKVIKATPMTDNIPQEMKSSISLLKNSFLKSTFDFKQDKKFTFDIDIKEMQTKGYWIFNKAKNRITVSQNKGNSQSVLMIIDIKQKEGKTIFIITESFYELEVQKM